MNDREAEDAATVEEYRAKFRREELIDAAVRGPRTEQLLAIERCGKAVGLKVDVSAVRSEEQAGRIIWTLMLLARRMR
jgi:hypothetical protein